MTLAATKFSSSKECVGVKSTIPSVLQLLLLSIRAKKEDPNRSEKKERTNKTAPNIIVIAYLKLLTFASKKFD
jgi:hypothetical protein